MIYSQLMTRLSIIVVMATSLLYVAIVAALSTAEEANARRNHRQRLLRNLRSLKKYRQRKLQEFKSVRKNKRTS
jgi:uncharacterized protein YlxW (UPF0749 family)